MIDVHVSLQASHVTAIAAKGHAMLRESATLSAPCLALSLLLRSFAEFLIQHDVIVEGNVEQVGAFSMSIRETPAGAASLQFLEGASQFLLHSLAVLTESYPNDVHITIKRQ